MKIKCPLYPECRISHMPYHILLTLAVKVHKDDAFITLLFVQKMPLMALPILHHEIVDRHATIFSWNRHVIFLTVFASKIAKGSALSILAASRCQYSASDCQNGCPQPDRVWWLEGILGRWSGRYHNVVLGRNHGELPFHGQAYSGRSQGHRGWYAWKHRLLKLPFCRVLRGKRICVLYVGAGISTCFWDMQPPLDNI